MVEPAYTYFFKQSDRDEWQSGHLAEKWRRAYPAVFDDDDIRILRTPEQRRYHFCEWLVATRLYEEKGYISLMENFLAKSHPRKRTTVENIVSPGVFEWMDNNKSGQPDLFVYHPSTLSWFLCEVKGPRDVIRENQKVWLRGFGELMRSEGLQYEDRWVLAEAKLAN